MRLGVEPCLERLAARRFDRQDIVVVLRVGLHAEPGHRGAPKARPPPQICVAIGFVDGQLARIAAGLRGDRPGHVAHPRLATVEAATPGERADVGGVDEGSGGDIVGGAHRAGHPLAGVGVFDLKGALAGERSPAGRRAVGAEDRAGVLGTGGARGEHCRRGQQQDNAHGLSRSNFSEPLAAPLALVSSEAVRSQ